MANTVLNVEGMTCSHCTKAVEQALMTLDGVKTASADLEDKTVAIDYDTSVINENELKKTINDAGYEVK
ncbi:MAG TPA: copper ion binding protein [Desulfobacteria bacterium]|nr:copper ion binding protein [Desulfobacteria bacterium]